MELNKIQSSGSWGKAADDLNQNFSKVNNAVEQVKNATTRNKGYFSSDTELKSVFPSANVGDIAYVGNSYPYQTWAWDGSAWKKKNNAGGEESVNLGDYYTKEETNEKLAETDEKLSELESDAGILEAETIVSRNTNLINENSLYFAKGFYIDNEGNIVSSTNFQVTGFIPIEEGKTYYFDGSHPTNSNRVTMRFVTAYDKKGVVLADKGQNNSGVSNSYTCPSGVAYVRISTYYDVTNLILTTIKGAVEPFQSLSPQYLNERVTAIESNTNTKLTELQSESGILEAKTIISRNTNLINENSLYFAKGFYIDNEGNIVSSINFQVTGYIPIEEGKTYYFDGSHPTNSSRVTMRFVTAYDENGLVLADKGQNNSGVANTYLCPEEVAFIRISTYSDVTNMVLTAIKGASEPFKPLSTKYLDERVATIEDKIDASARYKGFHIVPNKVFRLLGNSNGMRTDSVCRWDGDSVVIKPIDANGIEYQAMIYQYDANFNPLNYNNIWSGIYEETRMENAVYFDICIAKRVNGSYAVITESDLDTLTIYINENQSLPFYTEKTINMLGDSITAEGNVVNALKKYGYKVNNYGVSGTAICRGNDSFIKRYADMTDNCDIVLVLGGVNDWRTGIAGFGALEDGAGEWDFYQALHTLMLGLKDKYINADSNKKVYICTPLHNHYMVDGVESLTEFSYDGNKIIINKNTHNGEPYHAFKDYVIAEKEVAEFYGLPVIDTYSESGFAPIQELNRATYTKDGLHPNVAGGKLIADCIIRYFHYK